MPELILTLVLIVAIIVVLALFSASCPSAVDLRHRVRCEDRLVPAGGHAHP